MPVVSMFFGILIYMYYRDNNQHHLPHIHADYQGEEAIFAIESGDLLEGHLPPAKRKLVEAWIEIHREDLMADWALAVRGEPPLKIDPLK